MIILLQTTLFGVLRAAVEIFPVGGSAVHELILSHFFQNSGPGTPYAAAADAGVLLGLLLFFGKDLRQMAKESPALFQYPFAKNKYTFFSGCQYALTLSLVITASLAAAAIHYMLRESGSALSRYIPAAGIGWIIMGVFLARSRKGSMQGRSAYEMNHQDSFFIGMAEGLAVFPGFSRGGLGILAGMKLGIGGEEAMRFSYLLTLPYYALSLAAKLFRGIDFYEADQTGLCLSFIAALLTSLGALALVRKVICLGRFHYFGFYCLLAGILAAGYFGLKTMGI